MGYLHAQGGRPTDNVLYPQPDPLPLLLGLEVGYGWWENKGNFYVSDQDLPCAAFTNGTGRGFTVGAKGFIYLNKWFLVSPRVRYEQRSGTFLAPLPGEPVRNQANEIVVLEQEAQVDATIAAAAFDATLGVEFFQTGIYLFGGGSVSLLLGGTYDYTERVMGPAGFTYADTRTAEHTILRGAMLERYAKSAFDLRGGLGYMFRIDRFAINPEVFYSHPLTSSLDQPDELKQTGIIATLGILYNFGK